ncbi:MAG: MFS transporter [Thermoflexales bacterium]|nr:MFS transporter [Thermoflexales bacterium]
MVQQGLGLDYDAGVSMTAQHRHGLRLFYAEAPIATFSDALVNNYTNLFLVSLHATNAQIGLLGTLSQVLTALAPLLAAALAERTRAYKAHVVGAALLGRLTVAVILLTPLIPLGVWLPNVVIALFALRAFFMAWIAAPWAAFAAQIVPLSIRARYFAARNFVGGAAAIFSTLIAGQVIRSLGFPLGFQLIFALAVLSGVASVALFARIPAPAADSSSASAPAAPANSLALLRGAFSWRTPFGRYVLCSCAFAFAVNIGGPFIQVYQVRVLEFSAGLIGALLALEQAVNISAQRVYGQVVIKKFGDFRVMQALRFLTAAVPLAWIFVRDPIAAALVGMLAGAIWSGHELANFNNLLDVTPEALRARYVALHAFAVSVIAAVGPGLGGVLSELIGYQPLFFISGVLRILAALLLVVAFRGIGLRPAA